MKSQRGFTLIELLIALTIIGILVAIAIPNLLNAVHRGRQKRTMGDIRTIATANEAYGIDNGQYYVSAFASVATIAPGLEPTYAQRLPSQDGWATDFAYFSDTSVYRIWSWGKDGMPNGGGSVAPNGGTTSFNADMLFMAGAFVQFPDGKQI